ncbi:LiaI-LiaF-like domain-containing protein [Mucilaginibacter xinganensis]|uniref:LiaF transmembrane domain-containing protein n=1 Tax=Mucilaginibacter xinganensis TaxID=1234841 RepID=A0A223P2N7_9SPHI|nr:DUF5668 domain-containing protein [Mucilaginibacter xinganensis]ASU36352.1 hypothetical protein MuYL_4467 [Mucilaginibacter xinganensis]
MKNDKLIPGVILVLIGAAILLGNFGLLHFRWYNIFHLWPIFLVIAGVNLVFAHNKTIWATIIKISVMVIGVGLLFFGDFGDRYNFWPRHNFSYHSDDFDDNNDDDSDSSGSDFKMSGSGAFNEPYNVNIKLARLNITGGGTAYNLSDTTNQLFSASTMDNDSRYLLTNTKTDSVYVVNFKMKDHKGINFDSDKNKAEMRLNSNPIWDISVETGAASLDFDLSKFKIRDLKLHGGAASFNVKLGAPLALTNVDVSTGVSNVEISIPENAACSIETDSGLSGNDFEGFNKTRDNNYETPGFASAKNKIHIHISGGLSGFAVNRY